MLELFLWMLWKKKTRWIIWSPWTNRKFIRIHILGLFGTMYWSLVNMHSVSFSNACFVCHTVTQKTEVFWLLNPWNHIFFLLKYHQLIPPFKLDIEILKIRVRYEPNFYQSSEVFSCSDSSFLWTLPSPVVHLNIFHYFTLFSIPLIPPPFTVMKNALNGWLLWSVLTDP